MAYNYSAYPYYSQFAQANISPSIPTIPPSNNCQGASSLIWVQGEAGAKSYMVAPNNTVALWDSESQTVYLKSADASGMPSMRVLDYQIREDAPKAVINAPKTDYATKLDISTIQKQIDEIRANMNRRKEDNDESFVSST